MSVTAGQLPGDIGSSAIVPVGVSGSKVMGFIGTRGSMVAKVSGVQRRILRRIVPTAVVGLMLSAVVLPVTSATAAPGNACARRNNNTYSKLVECVTLGGVRAHQAQFQAIADSNDDEFYPGTRAAGTAGYADSVDYVAGLLTAAGYNVTLDPFEFAFNFPVLLQQLTPINAGTRAACSRGVDSVTSLRPWSRSTST